MGVRGLTTFIDAHPHLTMPYKLHDCTVVIDGNNLLNFLYSYYDINFMFGGDYITYASKVRAYFSPFRTCNINPIVIFDGGKDKSDRFLRTQIDRWRQRMSTAKLLSKTGETEGKFVPLNTGGVFKNVLLKLGIPFVKCEYESDNHIAALANHFNCPVLSDDSDFCIFDVKNGCIRISSLDCNVLTSEDDKTKYLRCKIYHLNKFLSFYPTLNKSILSLLASLAGNDYMKYEDLKPLSYYVYPQKGQKFEQILNYLSNRDYYEVIGEILTFINREEQEEFKTLLDYSMNFYKIKVSNLSYLFDINNTLSETKILSNSKLITPCGMPLPKEYVHKHSRGRFPSYFLNVIHLHRLFLRTQVGDFIDRSCYNCSCFVRQVIYGILFQHEFASANLRDHKLLCLRDVDEYDVDKGFEVFFRTKALFALPSGTFVPQLHKIEYMDRITRLEFLAEVMGIKIFYLKTIPENLHLVFGIISYWLRNCSPKPTKEFIIALLLCISHFNTLHTSTSTYSYLQDKIDADLSKMHSLLNLTANLTLNRNKKAENSYCNSVHYDFNVIHSYNQLQTCLKFLMSLNSLLGSPLKSLRIGEMFEGTMLYSLTRQLQSDYETEFFIELLLREEKEGQRVFNKILKYLLQNIPPDFPWRKTPNWNREKSNFYRKLGFKSCY